MSKTKKNPLSSTSSSSSSSSSRGKHTLKPSANRMSLAATRSMGASMGKSMALAGGKRRKGRRSRRGGDGAAEYVLGQYGTGDTQWDAVFRTGNPVFGNEIINQHHPSSVPAMAHKGGRKSTSSSSSSSSRKSRRSKRGGYWGQMISQALVPFGLLGLQQAYAKRTKKNRK